MSMTARRRVHFYVTVSPWLVGLVLFTGGPLVATLLLSLTDWNIFGTPHWIGIDNYRRLLTDHRFYVAVYNTLFYSIGSVVLMTVASLGLALLVNQKLPGMRVFRTIVYLPAVTSGVVLSVLWLWIYNDQYGILNYVLSLIGIDGPGWLTEPMWAKVALILMNVWYIGPNMLIFLAGLQGIPRELHEAAEVDGAGTWARFRHITLPLLSPVTLFVVTISVIYSFQVFTSAYVMTKGGPGTSTLFYALYLYFRAFSDLQMGYAAALATVLFMISLLVTLVQLRAARAWVYYEAAPAQGAA